MKPNKIIFLDRDGVINHFPGKGLYVVRQEAFEFLPGALEAFQLLRAAGYEVHIVSNQGCVSRGMISLVELGQLTEQMTEKVRKAGGEIQAVHYCVHQKSDACECKKPKTTLFEKALGGRFVSRSEIAMIGDSEEDMEAARRMGFLKVLVLSGRTTVKDLESFAPTPDVVQNNLLDAVQWILQKKF